MKSISEFTKKFKPQFGTFNIEKIVDFPPLEVEKHEDGANKKSGSDYAMSEINNMSEEPSEEDSTETDDDSESGDTEEGEDKKYREVNQNSLFF